MTIKILKPFSFNSPEPGLHSVPANWGSWSLFWPQLTLLSATHCALAAWLFLWSACSAASPSCRRVFARPVPSAWNASFPPLPLAGSVSLVPLALAHVICSVQGIFWPSELRWGGTLSWRCAFCDPNNWCRRKKTQNSEQPSVWIEMLNLSWTVSKATVQILFLKMVFPSMQLSCLLYLDHLTG